MGREGVRKTGMAMVVAVTPDVCLTPMGATPVPVPYPIVGMFDNVAIVAMSVRMCGRPTFTSASQVTTVMGDEAGTAGGVMSGVNKSICESVTASTTVKAEGNRVLRHGDVMKMNNGNTLGTVIFMPGLGPVIVGAPSDDTVDTLWGRMHKNKGGTLNFLKDVGIDLKDMAVGLWKSNDRQVEFMRKMERGDFRGAVQDWLKERAERSNPYNLIKPYIDAAMSDDPDELGAKVAAQLLVGLATDGVVDGLAGPEADAAAVDAGADADADATTEWEPEPDAARTTPMEAADPTPSSERPTAEMEAVDPDSTAKINAQDGVRVKGPPRTNGIPQSALNEGDICFGLYNKAPTMGEYLEGTGANVVSDLPNPPQGVPPPAAGYYSDVAELSKAYLDEARINGRQVHFDMNGVDPADAFNEGSPNYDKITSQELRHVKEKWDGYDPKPKFWKDGEEVPPPW